MTDAEVSNIEQPAILSLVYVSRAAHPFRETALAHLLDECRRKNEAADITGMLLHRGDRFLQVLEGAADTVRDLAERIRRDPRHTDMRVLVEESIDERRFPAWTMAYRAFAGEVGTAPIGFRDSFADVTTSEDHGDTMRALRELTLWFRVRTGESVAI